MCHRNCAREAKNAEQAARLSTFLLDSTGPRGPAGTRQNVATLAARKRRGVVHATMWIGNSMKTPHAASHPVPHAVGFDLGETLGEYTGIPLSWIGEYPAHWRRWPAHAAASSRRVASSPGQKFSFATMRASLREHLLTSVQVGRRKPHPAGFRALAARLGVPCADLLYVDNEQKDIVGANAAGCQTALAWRAACEAPAWGRGATLHSLDELRDLRYARG